MRRAHASAVLLLVLILTGCASNPTNRWAQGAIALTTTERSLIALDDAGLLSDEALVGMEAPLVGAKGALDKARQFLPDGGPIFDLLWGGFEGYLSTLREIESTAMSGGN